LNFVITSVYVVVAAAVVPVSILLFWDVLRKLLDNMVTIFLYCLFISILYILQYIL